MIKHVERELTKQATELNADEMERVSGGKPASNASPPTFLVFQFKLVAVKTV
jgi:hypothetical protein